MKLKDKKIRILNCITENDEYGNPIQEYHPIHTGKLWAYFRHMSAKEFYSAMTVSAEEEVIFIINWRTDIDAYNIIEYKGKYYNITRIDTYEGYKSDLTLYAKNNNTLDDITVVELT